MRRKSFISRVFGLVVLVAGAVGMVLLTAPAGFSANIRATTQPEDPAPQTMKS